MSSASTFIVIVIVAIIIVSLILLTRNSDSPPVPPPEDEFTLDSAKARSVTTPDVDLTPSSVIKEEGQTFKFPGSTTASTSVEPQFNYSFTTKTDLADLRTILVVEYILTDPNDNFVIGGAVGTVSGEMFYNTPNKRIVAPASPIEVINATKKIYKITHVFDLTAETVNSKTFKINSIFTRALQNVSPTDSTLSEVKMYEKL